MRSPATVSDPSAARRPAASRCAAWVACNGFINGVVSDARTGTPMRTMRPSSTDDEIRMNETTTHAAIAPDEAREDVVGPADAHGVRRHGVDDVAGGDLVGDRGAGLGDVMADDLDGPVGGVHPIGHGQLVAQRAADRLEQSERHDDADPQEEFTGVLVDDAVVDRGADGGPDERLTHHPADAEEGVEGQEDLLLRGDPDEVAQG